MNLSLLEREGLEWLRKKVASAELCICKADKGGSTLIVHPSLLTKKLEEKLYNLALYSELTVDPRKQLHDDLIEWWKYGKSQHYITEVEAKEVMGITKKDNKSTASRFKYGKTYFVPSLKIHKLKPEDIKPGADIPARLITCLQESLSSAF